MERMKTDRDTTFFVGDQLFTDVWGANRTGLYSILAKSPINQRRDPDCPETVSRGGSSHVLQETIEKNGAYSRGFLQKIVENRWRIV